MVKTFFPSNPLLPWHAVFCAPINSGALAYSAARSYGSALVDLGFTTTFFILNKVEDGGNFVHCLPYNGGSTLQFAGQIFDRNWGLEYNAV